MIRDVVHFIDVVRAVETRVCHLVDLLCVVFRYLYYNIVVPLFLLEDCTNIVVPFVQCA